MRKMNKSDAIRKVFAKMGSGVSNKHVRDMVESEYGFPASLANVSNVKYKLNSGGKVRNPRKNTMQLNCPITLVEMAKDFVMKVGNLDTAVRLLNLVGK